MSTTPSTVLCVDDDPDIVTSVARFLRLDGHDVVTCTSPVQALAVLGARTVAVMVSDYEMPEMTGVELAVKARRLQPETVRILLTGRGTLDTAVEGINVGEFAERSACMSMTFSSPVTTQVNRTIMVMADRKSVV